MANINNISALSTADLLKNKTAIPSTESGSNFADALKGALDETNAIQDRGDKAMAAIATGQVKDLHQAALSIDKAEMSMKMMLEVRNKALNAYKELSHTQI